MPNDIPTFSVVVPMRNEAGNVRLVLGGIEQGCAGRTFEVVIVDDGSSDGTAAAVRAMQQGRPWLRLVRHDRPAGQSAAIHSGVLAARSAIVCTMDGDGQNPPSEVLRILSAFEAPDASARLGLVAGQRVARHDALHRKASSTLANIVRRLVLRDGTRDTGCGLKAFRRDAFLALPYFDHMHRFLPALFAAHGWTVRHCDVTHAPRHSGRSNYGTIDRAVAGAVDLVGVAWLIRRAKRVEACEERAPE